MWIIFKFFGLLIGWNKWLMARRQKSTGTSIKRNRSYIRLPLKHDIAFSFHPETSMDRLFKSLGVSLELEVGDKDFDRKVYVGTNSAVLVKSISQNEALREHIKFLFKDLALHVKADAGVIEAKFYGERRDLDKSLEALKHLADWINDFSAKEVPKLRDPHFIRLLAVEFWITGFAFYGLVSWVEYSFSNRLIIDLGPIFSWSIFFFIVSFVIGVPLLIRSLKKSARSHQLLMENSFYLLLGFPVASFFLATDLNRYMDTSAKETFTVPVIQRSSAFNRSPRIYMQRTFGHRASVSSYRLKLDLSEVYGKPADQWVFVKHRYFDADSADLWVGSGYFGARHVEKMKFD